MHLRMVVCGIPKVGYCVLYIDLWLDHICIKQYYNVHYVQSMTSLYCILQGLYLQGRSLKQVHVQEHYMGNY